MKILWFSLSPCGSVRRNQSNQITCNGWMISLEDELKKNKTIDLNVAFFSSKKEKSFEFNGVCYYPMYNGYIKNPILRVLNRRRSISVLDNKTLSTMLEVVKNVNPNIIHIHGTEERFGLIQDYIKHIPIVYSIQGLIAPYKEKFFSGMPYSEVKRYESIKDKLTFTSIKDSYRNFCQRAEREKTFLSKAQYIFGRTFWDREITLAMNPHRKYYVVNEMLQKLYYKKIWKKDKYSDKLQLITTISGGVYKGYETILLAANILKKYSKIDFEWHIAGLDNNAKMVYIAEKITGLVSLNCNVVFHGLVSAEKLSVMLANADIYCHVSHIENSPNSVCEAMLVGMPIIASFAGGTSSIVENGKEGLLYQDGDPYILAGQIVKLYNDFERAKSFAKAARERALDRNDSTRVIDELLLGYNKILEDFKNKNL